MKHTTDDVTLRVQSDRILMTRSVSRRWWQLWKPKSWTEILAETPHTVRGNAIVKLMVAGSGYIALIDDDVVLRWSPRPCSVTGFRIQP